MSIGNLAFAAVGGLLALMAGPAAAAATACEGAPTDVKLNVVVDGVRSNSGFVTATLYANDEAHYLKGGGTLKVWRVPADPSSTTLCLWLPHTGSYAVAAYHDANSNLKWDHARLGAIEGFGFSRNPTIFFSPPPLKSTRFAVPAGDTTIHIRLSYR